MTFKTRVSGTPLSELVRPNGPHFQSARRFKVTLAPRTTDTSVYGPLPYAWVASVEGFARPAGQMMPVPHVENSPSMSLNAVPTEMVPDPAESSLLIVYGPKPSLEVSK